MAQAAAIAKSAAGADKAYSRVVACCCCSVAVKTSAGIWAQLYKAGAGGGGGGGGGAGYTDTNVRDCRCRRGVKLFCRERLSIEGHQG
eukprot:scaffold24100_cov56-Isochrysis_galbana.AAC.1